MATITTDENGNYSVTPAAGDESITLATADTYVDKNIVFNIQNHDHDLIYVNDYGLVNDGATDNLAAFNTLYAAHPHDILVFTGGTYCFSGQIDTYDTHILLVGTTIKFTGDHGYGFNMRGYNREDIIGVKDGINTTDAKEFPTYGEFIKGIDGTIDGNNTAGVSLISVGTGAYFEVSGLTLLNIGSADATSRQYGIYGTNPNAVGYKYERLVKDVKILNYDLSIPYSVGIGGMIDSYVQNAVIINMRLAIEAGETSVFYSNIHIWNYNWTSGTVTGTTGIEGNFIGENLYLDTVDYGFECWNNARQIQVNNLRWFINTETITGQEHFVLFNNCYDGSNMEIHGLDIGATLNYFSSGQFTSGIFTGTELDGSLNITYIPTTWNYKHKVEANSPVFTGTPKAPNPLSSSDNNQIATTHFVTNAILQAVGGETIVNDVKTYTVKIPLDTSAESIYADDAVGMTFGSADWDTMPLFRRIKPCVFKDGEVVYYLNKNDYNYREDGVTAADLTGNDGDVMVELPGCAYKITQDDTYLTVSVTNDIETALTKGYTANAFTYESVSDCGWYYIGAYEGSLDSSYQLRSLPNVEPTTMGNYNQFLAAARLNRTNNYECMSYCAITLIQCLYLIKYGNRDSRAAVGHGICNVAAQVNTGGTETLGMDYGTTENDTTHVKLFGIEDLWGNIWELTGDVYPYVLSNGNLGFQVGTNIKTNVDGGIAYSTSWGSAIASVYGNNNLGFLQKTMTDGDGIFVGGGGNGNINSNIAAVIATSGCFDSEGAASLFTAYFHWMTEGAEYMGSRLGYKKIGEAELDGISSTVTKDLLVAAPNGTVYKIAVSNDGIISAVAT